MKKLWTWLNGRKTLIGLALGYAIRVLQSRGVAVPDEVLLAADALFGLGLVHKAVKAAPRKAKAAAAVLLGLGLIGCQGLAQALGQAPSASAPAVYNIGVLAHHSAVDGTARNSRADQSGATGATSQADQSADMSQIITVDPEAVGKAITDLAALTPIGAAKTLLDAAQSELANGDVAAAKRLLDRALKARKAEESPSPPAPSPPQ